MANTNGWFSTYPFTQATDTTNNPANCVACLVWPLHALQIWGTKPTDTSCLEGCHITLQQLTGVTVPVVLVLLCSSGASDTVDIFAAAAALAEDKALAAEVLSVEFVPQVCQGGEGGGCPSRGWWLTGHQCL